MHNFVHFSTGMSHTKLEENVSTSVAMRHTVSTQSSCFRDDILGMVYGFTETRSSSIAGVRQFEISVEESMKIFVFRTSVVISKV